MNINLKVWKLVANEYKDDKTIKEFYEKLQLGHQSRRLDYLLMNMRGLHKKIQGSAAGGKLAEAIVELEAKRNKFIHDFEKE